MLLALTQIPLLGTHVKPESARRDSDAVAGGAPRGLVSSLTLALGTLAKNFRQGQAYATPLYFITIFPASIILFIPDFNPNLAYYLHPDPQRRAGAAGRDRPQRCAWPALGVTTASLSRHGPDLLFRRAAAFHAGDAADQVLIGARP